jgi:hypothetical protein
MRGILLDETHARLFREFLEKERAELEDKRNSQYEASSTFFCSICTKRTNFEQMFFLDVSTSYCLLTKCYRIVLIRFAALASIPRSWVW